MYNMMHHLDFITNAQVQCDGRTNNYRYFNSNHDDNGFEVAHAVRKHSENVCWRKVGTGIGVTTTQEETLVLEQLKGSI